MADVIGRLVGDNLLLAMLVVTWLSALASTVVANIPFTAAMLPIVGYLTLTIPGAQSKVLFYCLSVGSAMGGPDGSPGLAMAVDPLCALSPAAATFGPDQKASSNDHRLLITARC